MTTNEKTDKCTRCGADAPIIRGTYHLRESALKNVVLQGIEIVRCRECGNEDPIIPRFNDMMRTLALAVIGKPYRLVGEEVRWLRKFLGLTQDELARLIHVDKTTLSKWENDEDPIGAQSDLLLRAIAMIRGDGLRSKLDELVGRFAEIREARRRVGIELKSAPSETGIASFSYRYV